MCIIYIKNVKKLLTAIAMAGFLVCPFVVSAAYIIHLKDGRDFVTEQYLEEGNQIKFERYGGLIGIRKDLVREIEDVPDLPEEKKTPAAKPEVPALGRETGKKEKKEDGAAKTEASKQKRAERVEKATGKEQEKEKPVELSEEEKKKADQEKNAKMKAFLEDKRQIMGERDAVTSAFREAKARKDKKGAREKFRKIVALGEKLRELDEKVKDAYGGQLPNWWNDPE
jgi:hypothetical protein